MRLLLLIALAGCDTLLGLHSIEQLPDATPTYSVTGTFLQRYATNDSNNLPVVMDFIPDRAAGTVTLDDGSPSVFDYRSDGTFTFTLAHPGQAYRLQMQAGDTLVDIESDVAQLATFASYAARPIAQRTPVTLATHLVLFPSAAQGLTGDLRVASTGQWSLTDVGPASNGMLSLDWRTAGALAPPIGLLDATDQHDLLWVLEYSKASYESITHYLPLAIDQVDGLDFSFSFIMQAPAQTSCLAMTTSLAEESARWEALFADAKPVGGNWAVDAVPSYELGPAGALEVASAASAPPLPVTTRVSRTFFNPFAGSPLVVTMGIAVQRELVAGSANPFTISLGDRVWVETAQTTSCTAVDATAGVIAIAGDPRVDGTAIAADGAMLPLPATPTFTIAWDDIAPGADDYAGVTLFELKEVSMYTVPRVVDQTATASHSAWFPTAHLVAGHTYVVRVDTVVGHPNARAGDYATVTFPYGIATTWSHTFQVQ